MHSVYETGVIITDITNQMEEIGKIVDVISGIADQIGLLALNAAIEAARPEMQGWALPWLRMRLSLWPLNRRNQPRIS
jgi:hypothetical protein